MIVPFERLSPKHTNNTTYRGLEATDEQLYQTLSENGIEVLYGDREETPGVKFKDADLTRIPTLPLCYPLGYDVTLSIALHYLTGDFNYFLVYYFTVEELRAKARGSSTSFLGRNPPKHTLLRSFGASKGTLPAFIYGLKTRACTP